MGNVCGQLRLDTFTQQANLTGQPSISLPVYRDEQGLSLGVQLTAAKGREDLLLLHLAQQMEERSFLARHSHFRFNIL